jgi:DNA-binding GntR family transcriptional regulator
MDDPRKWIQIANEFRNRINSGELKPGDKTRMVDAAEAWGVSLNSARRAFRVLEREGVLKYWEGIGYSVAHRKDQ